MTQGASLTRNEGAKDRGEHRKVARALAQGLTARKRRVAGNLNSKPPISGAQLRAARALLKWSVRKLSDQCGVSESAISRGEQVNGTPPMNVRNLNMIRQVFEEHGIEFLGLDGVRLLAPELLPGAAISGQAAHEG